MNVFERRELIAKSEFDRLVNYFDANSTSIASCADVRDAMRATLELAEATSIRRLQNKAVGVSDA